MGTRSAAVAILAAVVSALAAASASADTLVYVKAGHAYVANVDGSGARAVTPQSQWWAWPSESDAGTIAVAGGAERVNPGGATESSGSSEIYAFDQHGNSLLSQPVHTPGSVSGPSSPTYVDHFRVSPDGQTVAYDVIGCCGFSGETTFTSPLRAGATWSQFQDDYIAPEWVDGSAEVHTANALGLTHNGATFGTQAEYAIFDAANSANNLGWSGDAAIPDGWGYTASFSRDTRKVALFLNDAADKGGTPQNVRIHLETINPDLSETDGCTITLSPDQFAQPHNLSQASVSFSPDGSIIAWGQGDGIHEASTADCGSQRLVVPGGAMPSFGRAPLTAGSAAPRITKLKVHGRTVTVRFGGAGTFKCKLDRARWKRCKSPTAYRQLKSGKHIFRLRSGRAVATKRFRIR